MRHDLLDLAILSGRLEVQLADPDHKAPAQARALDLLDQAETLFGTNRALLYDRYVYAKDSNRSKVAEQARQGLESRGAAGTWDRVAYGRSLLESGDLENARMELEKASQEEPRHFWAQLYLGKCLYLAGRFSEAQVPLSIAEALNDAAPQCACNLAANAVQLGQLDLAMEKHSRALHLDPDFAPAYLGRGNLFLLKNKWSDALGDGEKALAKGIDPADGHFLMSQALVQLNKKSEALKHLRMALRVNPGHLKAKELRNSLEETK
jgi:tetratricopeptide (TPR) repeat protein